MFPPVYDTLPTRVLFKPFPKQEEFLTAALGGDYDFVLYGGAIRGGKTYALLALFLVLAKIYPGSRWAIVRKDMPTIERNLYPSWDKIKPTNFIPKGGHNKKTHTVTFTNGSQIIFFPESFESDKDLDRWKGLEVNGFGFEEINECRKESLMKAFERAGSYIIPARMAVDGSGQLVEAVQPRPLVVATCNPTFGWVKQLVYTPHKEGKLPPRWKYIQSRIHDNEPLLRQQPNYLPSLKANLSRFQYMVFVEGNWDVQLKTGGEFLTRFEIDKHVVAGRRFRPDTIAEISWDSNVLPYVAVSIWQLQRTEEGGWMNVQIAELPCRDPDNSPRRAALKVAQFLRLHNYELRKVRIYGDRSTKARNNIDEQKRSFFQIMMQTLSEEQFLPEDRMLSYAPSVSNMGDFVNAIFDGDVPGLSIGIAEECTESISDYIDTKTDRDGTLLKIRKPDYPGGPSYEHNGHLTDTLKDFICSLWNDIFIRFCNRSSSLQPDGITVINRSDNLTP